jgi:F0F1-type ATP synthase delta subunit
MEYLKEIKEIYKDINVNKNYKGIKTDDDLNLVLKSTQLSKETKREIILLWREDPIYKLEQKYGKEMLNRVLQKKKDEICEQELNNVLSKLTNEEITQILHEKLSI